MDTAAIVPIETDYLVVGAGAAGMAFADTLLAESDADIVLVDRRHKPGGHWVDAYPFVRLHQPSAFYGVNSLPLGSDQIETTGPNAGFYEQATGAEIREYYERVLDRLIASGRVRHFGGCNYTGNWADQHAFLRYLTGEVATVKVRRRLVDTTYLETATPSARNRNFSVDDTARVVTVAELPSIADTPRGFTVIGGGKTAMDACCWLLGNGVDPDRITWIRPRDAWMLERAHFQCLDLVANFVDGMSRSIEAMAEARDTREFHDLVEESGMLVRLDSGIEPTMFRGAITSEIERTALRQIERVVRHGRVLHLGRDRVVLDRAEIRIGRDELFVDCSAYGLGTAPGRPTFEPGRITIQGASQTTFYAAMTAFIEANRDDDVEKNRLCAPSVAPSRADDWICMLHDILQSSVDQEDASDLLEWRSRCRLNITRGVDDRVGDPRIQQAMSRWATHRDEAIANASRLVPDRPRAHQPSTQGN